MNGPEVLGLLAADGPHPDHIDRLMTYGQFVGSWDIEAVWYAREGGERRATGEWHFAWILGGLGVQDILFGSGAESHDYGTSLRCYDPKADVWQIVWMQPSGGEFVHLVGRSEDGRIVQEVVSPDPKRRESWSFVDVTPNTFRWLDEVSLDDGVTWFLEHEMQGTRRTS